MACRTGCRTKDHANYHECLRAASITTSGASPSKGLDMTSRKAWDRELDAYRSARRQGIQPDGTTMPKIEAAIRASDAAGAAYGRDFSAAGPMA